MCSGGWCCDLVFLGWGLGWGCHVTAWCVPDNEKQDGGEQTDDYADDGGSSVDALADQGAVVRLRLLVYHAKTKKQHAHASALQLAAELRGCLDGCPDPDHFS